MIYRLNQKIIFRIRRVGRCVFGAQIRAAILVLLLCFGTSIRTLAFVKEAGTPLAKVKVVCDVVYASPDGHNQLLDLYLPASAKSPVPLILFIHGGGWEAGDKNCFPEGDPIGRGYAVASIDYRLSQVAKFPAQIEDCKAAVRWIRTHASEYNIDPNRIAAWGYSAGGHLAALLGTSGGVRRLEGANPENKKASSRVQAVVDCCGPADFTKMGNYIPDVLERLLGGTVSEKRGLAVEASPVTYVTKDDPPFLIIHGKLDDLVPWQQSQELHNKLIGAGVESELHLLPDAGHGFGGPEIVEIVYKFLGKHLNPFVENAR